ncbi:MAG: hypothetical protein V2I43_16720 [Parvularcula sp.]|jgi:hypothetical protein|nr:hypothetical protein [Parvularcula sp.]
MVRPKIDILRLRDIAWTTWDPLSLTEHQSHCSKIDWSTDEYDSYILKAFGPIWNHDDRMQAAAYLRKVEVETMGLNHVGGPNDPVENTVRALEEYAQELRAPRDD